MRIRVRRPALAQEKIDVTHIQDAVRDALEREAVKAGTHQEAAVPLPSGWARIDVVDMMDGQAEANGIVMLEKTLPSGEVITVVSSREVVNRDDELEEEEEEEHENGFAHAEESILFLVVVDKPKNPLPLFFECVGDRFGFEILRVHLGLGMAGFMSDHTGHPSLLYHACMSQRDARLGRKDNAVPGDVGHDEDVPEAACSPEFDALDARLQDTFVDFLAEKHVDAVVVEALFDSVMAKGHDKYMHFLHQLSVWLK